MLCYEKNDLIRRLSKFIFAEKATIIETEKKGKSLGVEINPEPRAFPALSALS